MINPVNMMKYSHYPRVCLACLAIITEGIRSLFEAATGGQDKFFRVFIAYQDNETGYIISYDNSALNLSNYINPVREGGRTRSSACNEMQKF